MLPPRVFRTRFLLFMKSRILPICVVAGAALLAACGEDPFAVQARFEIASETLTVYSLNGTPATAPTGLNTPFLAAVRADSSFNFDVAFDIDAAGDIRVIPVSRVGSAFGVTRRIGIATVTQPFDSLRRAPNSGYVFDSTVVVNVGQTFVVQAVTPYCQLDLSPMIYSKLVVDSIDAGTRAIHLRLTADPNCGFMSFLPGIPEN